jgi:hypothetical protein
MAKVIKGTSEEIGCLVLGWAGLDDLWDEHELGGCYNPATEVVEWCDGGGLDVRTKSWDADRPMYSEIDYTVRITDAAKAKASLLERIEELIEKQERP